MTKCLFKALKAVDLEEHVGLFRSLGYESAGALAHFRTEHFEKLNFSEQDLLRLIALLDVLKESTRDGKICPHYFTSTKTTVQQSNIKTAPIFASWSDETIPKANLRKPINGNLKPKRSNSSIAVPGRSSSMSMQVNKPSSANDFISQRSSTVLSRQNTTTPLKNATQRFLGPRAFLNRPAVQHVKVKSYNYGVPNNRRPRNTSHRTSFHHNSFSVSSPRHSHDLSSYGKPAEIYVYARKRPLLPTESNFQDVISVPDNKRVIIAENKANLDCTPLLKKTEFQFDHVFGSDVSNREIFQSTVFPFISPTHRHNLTYICFGQTGSGKSHTIFGGKSTDGLLVYCTQMLLKETITAEYDLIGSFYEIYNNQVYDLINPGKRLFVREDGEHHVNVIGARQFILGNLDHLRAVIDDGLARRHHGKSAFNSNSSRSHAIFQISLKSTYNASESFRLIFIDLAGSERATDAQNNLRQTRREGAQINWSLLALKECIRSMDLTHSHAPFRQSKLTHILRDSLVGSKTRTCLMATVSPSDDCCQCSLNTLQYASRIRDISMRHRHRPMPVANPVQTNYFQQIEKEEQEEEKPQRNFKPATASTPVQRLIPVVDQRIYSSINTTDRIKPTDIDWEIADDDDDVPINGNGDNHPLKPIQSTTQDNDNGLFHRYSSVKLTETVPSPSSYFPAPQSDIKKSSSKRSLDNSRLLHANGNDRKYKVVPAPTTTKTGTTRLSQSSANTRMIPVHTSDDNPYSSATGTESLGTKISKAATNGSRHQRTENFSFMDNLNLPHTVTSESETMVSSAREEIPDDERGFFNRRNELLSIVSSRLTPTSKRSASANSKSNSSPSNKSKNSHNSPAKTRSKTRPIKSASSTTSLASFHEDKKSSNSTKKSKIPSSFHFQKFDPSSIRRTTMRHSQRAVPLRVHHSSDSEEYNKSRHRRKGNSSIVTRSEACQMNNNDKPASIITPISTPLPNTQPKQTMDQSFQQQHSPDNIINPWPITSSYSSPSKEFGIRVSDQLNALRSLLENRLIDHDPSKSPIAKETSTILQTSPGTFARQFLQSVHRSPYRSTSNEFVSGDDEDDKEVERTFPSNQPTNKFSLYSNDFISTGSTSSNHTHPYESIRLPPTNFSSLSDELNRARMSSQSTPTSSSMIESNLAAKIDPQEQRTHQPIGVESDSERTSSEMSSAPHALPSTQTRLSPFDTEKENSAYPTASFDALLNSLKNMREKDLDFLVRNTDDKLIPVID